jgi:L-rhamnose mutarotase
MKIIPGREDEYRRRHIEIWDELKELLETGRHCRLFYFL